MGSIASREKRAVAGGCVSLERPAKRLKIGGACDGGAQSDTASNDGDVGGEAVHESGTARSSVVSAEIVDAPSLPPEVWAAVMDHLDFQSVLSCSAVSRSMLRGATPLVGTLHIDTASQMNAALATRFRDVRTINLFSVLTEEVEETAEHRSGHTVEYDAVVRAVPFLSRFPSLRRVFFGGKRSNGDVVGLCSQDDYLYEDDWQESRSLIDSMSGFFQASGGLTDHIRVAGLRCPNSTRSSNDGDDDDDDDDLPTCDVCQRACESFPLLSVVCFDSRGSSQRRQMEGLVGCERSYFLDACLSRSQIESIVETRPGGSAILRSKARFLHLLGQGNRYDINADGGKPLCIVHYGKRDRNELERAIQYAQLDFKTVASHELIAAIRRSCAKGGSEQTPPKNTCFLSVSSWTFLSRMVGLEAIEDFRYPAAANVQNLPQILGAISGDNSFAKKECATLLEMMLRMERPITQQQHVIGSVVDSGVVPKLVASLCEDAPHQLQFAAATVLGYIVTKGGTLIHAQCVVDAGAIPAITRRLGSSSRKVARRAAHVLGRMAEKSESIREIVKEAAMLPLLNLATMWKEEEVLEVALDALEALCSGSPLSISGLKPCMDVLSRLLLNEDEKVLSFACQVLSAISGASEKQARAVLEAGLYQSLLELLNMSSEIVLESALKAMEVLLTMYPPLYLQFDFGKGAAPGLLSCISNPAEAVTNAACKVLSSVVSGATKEQMDAFVTEDFIQSLVQCPLKRNDESSVGCNLLILAAIAGQEYIELTDNEIQLIEERLRNLESDIECIGGNMKVVASDVAACLRKRRNGEELDLSDTM